jgi:hypothetical protein
MKTKEISSDQGPRFEVYDAFDTTQLFLSAENMTGTSSWTPHQLEFETGPKTELLIVRVRRPPSRKLDNRIAGSVWIDRISVNAAE